MDRRMAGDSGKADAGRYAYRQASVVATVPFHVYATVCVQATNQAMR